MIPHIIFLLSVLNYTDTSDVKLFYSTPEQLSEWEIKAKQGDREAQFNVGLFYYYGKKGFKEKDEIEAFNLFNESAKQGFIDAEFYLGLCYSHGHGVTENKIEGLKWYRKAADKGHAGAQFCVGRSYEEGLGVAKDSTQSIKWYHIAAAHGDARGLFILGCNFEDGYGQIKDPVEAYAYFNLAGITSKVARERRDRLEKKMTTSQIDAGIKRSRELQAEIDAEKKSKWWQIIK
jgi:TPR repeat protein